MLRKHDVNDARLATFGPDDAFLRSVSRTAGERMRSARVVGDCVGCRMHLLTLEYGFEDETDVPTTLALARERGSMAFDPGAEVYVCAEHDVHAEPARVAAMANRRRRWFMTMARHGGDLAERLRRTSKTFTA